MAFGRRLVAAVVCAPLLVVGGCADDPEPKLAPPDDTPTSASSSPSASPTREPWEKKTNAGAVAFARHWIDTFSAVMDSGETRRLLELSAPECVICRDFAQRLDRIESSGGFYESEGWRVLATSPVPGMPAGEARVSMRIRQAAERLQETASSEVVRNPESVATWSAELRWVAQGWQLQDLELVG